MPAVRRSATLSAPRPLTFGRDGAVLGARTRLALALLVVATLAAIGAGVVFDIAPLRGSATAVFLLVELGIAPCLLLAPVSAAWFALLAGTVSLAGTISVGFAMAILHVWQPDAALAAAAAVTLGLLALSVRRDVRAVLTARRAPAPAAPAAPRRAEFITAAVTGGGLVLAVVSGVGHQGPPRPEGLYGTVGPLWFAGLALIVAAAVFAYRARASLAVPVLTLSAIAVLSQAVVYGSPTVATAARHVGVVQYIRANGGLQPELDIYQAWSGLFAGAAWVCDAGRIADPMVLATWWPVLLSPLTALAAVLMARRWLPDARRAWLAGAVFALTSTLNIVYFSPQSVGILFALVIFAVLPSARRRRRRASALAAVGASPAAGANPATGVGPAAGASGSAGPDQAAGGEGRAVRHRPLQAVYAHLAAACRPIAPGTALFVLFLSCVVAVTHQISPYLAVAALGVLWIVGYMRPLWMLLTIIVPALAWAGINTDTLGRFISLGAVGRFWENAQSPTHADTRLPVPEITRLAFDVPAAVLLVVGLLAAYYVLRYRTRPAWALALAGASPVSLFGVTDYGQEGIFRVTLFAAPWLSALAVALVWPAVLRRWRAPVLGAGLAVLLAVNVFGQTALDWNRITPRDAARATALFETTAPRGSVLFLTGTSVVSPINISAHYLDVGYIGREALRPFPAAGATYDAAADVRALTRELVRTPAPRYYALVSTTIGAYDARYGYQSWADYRRLAAAMAASPSWRPILTGPTTTLYVFSAQGR